MASAARLWVPLRSPCDIDDVRRGRGLARVRAFVDAYGLDDGGRTGLVAGVRDSHDWMVAIVREGAESGVPGFAAYWGPDAAARARRTDAWLERNTDILTAALL